MSEQALIEDVSPNGNLLAFVEQDERCAYLYLQGAPESGFGMRSCWVRNLAPAPERLDVESMKQGLAPLLPRAACAHPEGAAPLEAEQLGLVWFEEGDAVALLERGEAVAIIPGWSGLKGFEGYARDCREQSPLCWPLLPDNVLHERVRRAAEFWRTWEQGEPWPAIQEAGVSAVERAFGKAGRYFAIDGGAWPPKALLQVEAGGATVLVTCGVGIRPQPRSEQSPGAPRRIELGLAMEPAYFARNPKAVLGFLSALTSLPWERFDWLGDGHTVDCGAIPMSPQGVRYEAALLLRAPQGAPELAFAPYRGDPVELLWLVPITAAERELARAEGSAALVERLAAAGHGWVHRYRDPVV